MSSCLAQCRRGAGLVRVPSSAHRARKAVSVRAEAEPKKHAKHDSTKGSLGLDLGPIGMTIGESAKERDENKASSRKGPLCTRLELILVFGPRFAAIRPALRATPPAHATSLPPYLSRRAPFRPDGRASTSCEKAGSLPMLSARAGRLWQARQARLDQGQPWPGPWSDRHDHRPVRRHAVRRRRLHLWQW